ncbi:hypothetical protein AAFF_G00062580 [Aldrovandia affinis]|uniref:Uncharacterized protein n=1 Tax=Aldrovandia affinis TaxID=143900 RepID=A0AAD7S1V5_9TELE|nr:hypothetical protein AAFF_G00062580 [Aldrovandia affinis]
MDSAPTRHGLLLSAQRGGRGGVQVLRTWVQVPSEKPVTDTKALEKTSLSRTMRHSRCQRGAPTRSRLVCFPCLRPKFGTVQANVHGPTHKQERRAACASATEF